MTHPRNTNLSFQILREHALARTDAAKSVCALLPPNRAADVIVDMAASRQSAFSEVNEELVAGVADAVKQYRVERNITDWPFENFWGNPDEPRHSKLLGYFIDPEEGHRCGKFLMQRLFEVLGLKGLPVDDHCRVECEADCKGEVNGRIDLLICRNVEGRSDEAKYAVIVENKVNGASDQCCQLERYVAEMISRGFRYDQIHVVYLPLLPSDPSDCSLGRLEPAKVILRSIGHEIMDWLKATLDAKDEWPEHMQTGMADNLKHYLNLVDYLVNKRRGMEMSETILKQLKKAQDADKLPTWNEVSDIRKAATELQKSYEAYMRGEVLFDVRRRLREKGFVADFFDGNAEPVTGVVSPFDARFMAEMNVGVRIGDIVTVCAGAKDDASETVRWWTGYMRCSDTDDQESFITFAGNHLPAKIRDEYWYMGIHLTQPGPTCSSA